MKKNIFIGVIIIVAVIGLFTVLYKESNKPGKYDAFAQCVTDSGAKFFGAWWCPHCQNQKAALGRSGKLLPYIECQTPDRKNTPECTAENITSFPTWKFADGSIVNGEMKIEALAEKTSCMLPEEVRS